ncbi:glycosyltransferase [Saccharicrinis fermentans]|uniref:GDP-mannose-dependent alpha-(1-2)-phosphatidylinositol mannosyltransferase n=1 Tax=Saccharicrinis fermentans DSM 9555 = JCM 21142 TaxID=869213 RepID=W7YFM0_9BACT|nr:glycosyltransferase [Saccharicrinis fermentans]GAF03246.1 GDP-mannose-dependent alpha-(1-2)-phosphatidylinositol mannosyltransferase [Saccharicrinis fermentans DSM 9555 = JCM 21142]
MNILFVYQNWLNPNRGGVGRVADSLAMYLVQNGHRVYYLMHEYDENDTYKFPAQIFTLPHGDFFSATNVQFYHHVLHEKHIDIVLNHDASNERSKFWLETGASKARKVSLYHTDPLHGLNRNMRLGKVVQICVKALKIFGYRKVIGTLLKNSDKLVLLSQEFKKNMSKELKINSSKIVAISNPCVFEEVKFNNPKKKQILFVGRLDWSSKRPDIMLRIWSHLYRIYSDWELLVLGDGPDRVKTQELARELKLERIFFKGFVKPEPFYKEASIICLTSDYEGFGLVMPEAMQYGVVPIAFNNWPSLKDIVVDGENGVIARQNDIPDFVAKLELLMSDATQRASIALRAKDSVKKFHIGVIGPQWIELFKTSIKNG